jgi:hypothetical protein
MAEINNPEQTGANPDNGALNNNQPQNNEGIKPTEPQVVDNNSGKTYSQKDLDGAQAKARGTAERETRRKLLAQLGLKEDEEDKLLAFKEAYQNSLSDEEKRQTELSNLQAENLQLTQDLEEKDYVVKALIELTGKNEEDVDKIVKMAKGLKTADNTIEDAIKEVISMVNPVVESIKPAKTVIPNPNMPTGQEIQQPSTTINVDTTENPFKAGSINLTKQGQLLRTNPELAKKLAAEAGVNLKF